MLNKINHYSERKKQRTQKNLLPSYMAAEKMSIFSFDI